MKVILPFLVFLVVFISCDNKKKEVLKVDEIIQNDSIFKEAPGTQFSHEEEIEEVHDYEKHEIIFTVQIAALQKENSQLENYQDVKVYHENGYVKYRMGAFYSYEDAFNQKKNIRDIFPGAFIQALKDNTPISIEEALNKE